MLPPDLASQLRLSLPTLAQEKTPQVLATQKISDILGNLVPGQRIMAEIQTLLPNGTYRAIVAQRELTLALPFAAKAGDSLELEVVETDGKIALAFVANRSTEETTANKPNDSVATTLSQAGKLIGNLLSDVNNQGQRAAPAPLNGNRPLVNDFPDLAANLAPVLKDALTKSGVFYEAHQARWVAGELPTAALRLEPQGKTPPTIGPVAVNVIPDIVPDGKMAETHVAANVIPGIVPDGKMAETHVAANVIPEMVPDGKMAETHVAANAIPDIVPNGKMTEAPVADAALPSQPRSSHNGQALQATSPGNNPIPRDLTPIVQQQLDALATQNYAWQGQIWPGQKMQWEIGENLDGKRSVDADPAARWQTRLKLSLPGLGGVDAVLRLRSGGAVDITVTADSENGESRLRDGGAALRSQLEAAGLNLTQLLVRHGEAAE